jgi:beta-galactosidase
MRTGMRLGVCYYPEHWEEWDWEEDARLMRAAGITHVRIGEFAWARIEPVPGQYDWDWLDRVVDILHLAGLEVTLGTPTATPPKWLVDAYPDVLPLDEHGHPRRFGSRRHYCFSSRTYRREASRIVEAMARRYGCHPGVKMWQTDNEFGHHGSDESFSRDAVEAFRGWLEMVYGDIAALNRAWGSIFWSQTYTSFSEVDPPAATVTEANPSHRLAWRRFCSDQMCCFNQLQVDIIRKHSPGRPITHNFIGDFYRLDHREISKSLDIASWDSYPIGLLSESAAPLEQKSRWLRTGHPDFAAFNHDVFRACAPRWSVMEQQPGPVNWATYNAAPAPGMVRLWTWEAFAHGAEFVSYFRWRQAPFAQEQMHAGLLGIDRTPQKVLHEIGQVALERAAIGSLQTRKADVAIYVDYPSLWQHEIQPQGNGLGPLASTRQIYTACRTLGLDIDIVFSDSDLSDYKIILVPSVPILSDKTCARMEASGAIVLATPLTGSRTEHGHIPEGLPPGGLAVHLGLKVKQLETLPPFEPVGVLIDQEAFNACLWHELIETEAEVYACFSDGSPAWVRKDQFQYLAAWPDEDFMIYIVRRLCEEAGVVTQHLGPDLRLRRTGNYTFVFNYGSETIDLDEREICPPDAEFTIGSAILPPFELAVMNARDLS